MTKESWDCFGHCVVFEDGDPVFCIVVAVVPMLEGYYSSWGMPLLTSERTDEKEDAVN